QSLVPWICRLCILSKANDELPSPSSRSHSPTNSLASSVRKKPRSSIVLPAKSTGTPLVIVENWPELELYRSSLPAHRPECTTLPPERRAAGGPPPQPPGRPPGCPVSKLSTLASAERSRNPPASCAWHKIVSVAKVATSTQRGMVR